MIHSFETWLRNCSPEHLGIFGERLWANLFQLVDLHYTPLCQHSVSGAPMLQGNAPLIQPDYEVCAAQLPVVLVEVKTKTCPVLYRHANELRHGIDREKFLHYQDMSLFKQAPCALAIFECFQDREREIWSGSLLLQTLAVLGKCTGGFSNQEHMVYWPRGKFVLIGQLSPQQTEDLYGYHENTLAMSPIFKDLIWQTLAVPRPKQRYLF